jgi:hypothetical protein
MPKKKKSTVKKAADDLGRLPEATAHTFRREMELPHEAIEKFREVLAEGLPVKISLDVTSKIFAPLVENKKSPRSKSGTATSSSTRAIFNRRTRVSRFRTGMCHPNWRARH